MLCEHLQLHDFNFCLLPAEYHNKIVQIRNFERHI